MTDLPEPPNGTPEAAQNVFVLRVDCSVASTRQELLARLRRPEGDGLHTRFWRFEALRGGAVLAERHGGAVIIHQEACREMLGEDV